MVTRRKWRAASKVVVFSLLKREGKVYTAIALTAHTNSRLPTIRQKVYPNSLVYTDVFRAYQAPWHQEFAPSSDSHVFFRDSAFRDDDSQTNMDAILEQNGITHVRSL